MLKYPKDLEENLRFRANLLQKSDNDTNLQDMLREQCKRDVLFFFNVFIFTYDPRRSTVRNIPFITYPFQDDAILWDKKCAEDQVDNLEEKSRDTGCTWMACGNDLHDWLFKDEKVEIRWGSRKEQYVDTRGDMDSIFEKFRHILRNIPKWLLPKGFEWNEHDNSMRLINPETGSSITGESSNANFGRGGRKYRIRFDEFAFWESDVAAWKACYSKDTEVLTDSGWMLVKQVTTNNKVYSMDMDTKQARYMPVEEIHKKYYDSMIHFKGKSVDLVVSKDHNMVISRKKGDLFFEKAEETYSRRNGSIPLTSKFQTKWYPKTIYGFNPSDWMEFLGWYISEGWIPQKNSTICISQSSLANPENKDRIRELLQRMGCSFSENLKEFYVHKKSIPKKAREELISLGKCKSKYIPQRYLESSPKIMRSLLGGLVSGDGNICEREGRKPFITYTTASKKLADNIQDIVQKIGKRGRIRSRVNDIGTKIFVITIANKENVLFDRMRREEVEYNDFAYCLTTPLHTLYVRRNGIASWCGNCADSTNCRTAISTPNGASNKFAELARSNIRKKALHWTQHPLKNIGVYRLNLSTGEHESIDISKNPDAAYKTWIDVRKEIPPAELVGGLIRSIWYDKECERRKSSKEVAEELDIDYARSGIPFFDLNKLGSQYVWEVLYRNNPYDVIPYGRYIITSLVDVDNNIEVRENRTGWLRIFEMPVKDGQYVIGADISEGLEKQDESFAVVRDKWTRNVVAACNGLYDPDDFAIKLEKLGKFYNGCLTAPENNNHGFSVCSDLKQVDCNLYWTKRKNPKTGEVVRVKAGWTTTSQSRPEMLDQAKEEVRKESNEIRDKVLIEQMEVFVHNDKGKPEALGSFKDDGVIAYSISGQVIKEYPYKKVVKKVRRRIKNPISNAGIGF